MFRTDLRDRIPVERLRSLKPRFPRINWQARQDLNPQPPVLETDALPLELQACLRSYLVSL